MKIKLAILDQDKNYLSRIITAFSNRFADKLQIYSFTKADDVMYETVKTSRIDVLLASEAFEIDFKRLSDKCGFAYFVESTGVDSYNDKPTICKFQKADIIYKEILNVFSDIAGNISGLNLVNEEKTSVITFTSASGGTGCSTVAAACAKYLAMRGQKPLYLNFEVFGGANEYFTGNGQYSFSDVIYSIKSKKSNIAMKLESCVKQDESGVYFYDACNIPLDLLEMKDEEIQSLIRTLRSMDTYTHIIVDTNMSLDEKMTGIFKVSSDIVFVADGKETSNKKFERLYKTLSIVEQQKDLHLLSSIRLIYNRFSNKTSKEIPIEGISLLGGIPRYEGATAKQIVDQISKMDVFKNLV